MPQAPPRQKITIFRREMCANFWNKKKLEYDNETIERERDRLDEVSARLRTCMIIGTQRLQQ